MQSIYHGLDGNLAYFAGFPVAKPTTSATEYTMPGITTSMLCLYVARMDAIVTLARRIDIPLNISTN